MGEEICNRDRSWRYKYEGRPGNDGTEKFVKKMKEPTSEEVLGSLLSAIESLYSEEIAGIGLGVAGLISRETDRVLISPNLHSHRKDRSRQRDKRKIYGSGIY